MVVRREAVVGWGSFAVFFATAVAVGAQSNSMTIRAFSFLVGIGAGGAMGVMLALATHLAGRAAEYEPIPGEDGAWGVAEFEDRAGKPP